MKKSLRKNFAHISSVAKLQSSLAKTDARPPRMSFIPRILALYLAVPVSLLCGSYSIAASGSQRTKKPSPHYEDYFHYNENRQRFLRAQWENVVQNCTPEERTWIWKALHLESVRGPNEARIESELESESFSQVGIQSKTRNSFESSQQKTSWELEIVQATLQDAIAEYCSQST